MDIIKGIKEVADIVRKADNIDLYRQILDLQKEALDLVEENHNLKNQIRELKRKSDLQDNLVFQDNTYLLKSEKGWGGPFCSKCWDYESKLVRIHESEHTIPYCPVCVSK